ncbi:MAG TPA: hypothetical protein V6C81_31775 [Planktothrix sp.]|jgi:archaellum component FlaF (FlaF/FlaG flagellin family)
MLKPVPGQKSEKSPAKVRKTVLLSIASGLGVLVLIAIVMAFVGKHEITVTQAQLQQRIDAALNQRLAQQHDAGRDDIVISSAQLQLSDSTVTVSVAASGSKFKHAVDVNATAHGKLRYEKSTGSFYFDPDSVDLTKLEIDRRTIKENAEGLLDQLGASDERKGKLSDEAEAWVHTKVERLAMRGLQHHAVYTFPASMKGQAGRALLQGVEVKNGTIVLHVSYLQLVGTFLIYALVFVAAVFATVLFLCRKPV